MSCDVGEVTENLENQNKLWRRWGDWTLGEWAELILQAFSHLTYVTAHSDSPCFLSLHLRHSSFSNPSLTLPTSQLILQPFRCFTYVTAHFPTLLPPLLRHRFSLTSPGDPPMTLTLLLPPRQNNYLRPCSPTLLSLLQRHKLFT